MSENTTTPGPNTPADSKANIPQSIAVEPPQEVAPTETIAPDTETTITVEATTDLDEDTGKSETLPEAIVTAVAEPPDAVLENTVKRKRDESSNETEDSDGPFSKTPRADEENKEGPKANKQEYTRWSVEPHCAVVRNVATN